MTKPDTMPATLSPLPKTQRLYGIEALRGIAAAAVVFSHVARHIDHARGAPGLITAFQAGHSGVDLFFTLSGFIILFVHRQDIGRPFRLTHYARRRFNRVFPLYWLALGLTAAMSAAGRHGAPALGHLAWSATLLPSFSEPVLGVAWTLQFEIVFYLIFAALIANRQAGAGLLASWLVLIVATAAGFGAGFIPGQVSGFYGGEFFAGMLVAQALHCWRIPKPRLLLAAGAGAFAAALVLESAGILNGFGLSARFAYAIPAGLLIMAVAELERSGSLQVWQWLRTLGGASYSIYLFQFVFIGALWQALVAARLDRHTPTQLLVLAMAAFAIGGGVLVARFVERPLLRFAQSPRKEARLRFSGSELAGGR